MKKTVCALLTSIAVNASAGWEYNTHIDVMDEHTDYHAYSDINATYPENDSPRASIWVSCVKGYFGAAVMVDKGYISIDGEKPNKKWFNAKIRAKFDGIIYTYDVMYEARSTAIFILNDDDFIEKLKYSDNVIIEVDWAQETKDHWKFSLAGSTKVIEKVDVHCSVKN